MKKVEVTIPDFYSEDEFKDFFQEEETINRLNATIDYSDVPDRAEVYNLQFDDVEIKDDSVEINYSYEWHLYAGCDDYNRQDTVWGTIIGIRDDRTYTFEVVPPKLIRSTVEEF